MAQKWLSDLPEKCEMCKTPLRDVFVDGKTAWGPWAIMCVICHRDQGFGFGIGRGQKFDLKTRELLEGGSTR
ncbi:MAG TPA: hypothetical protein VFR05_09720 [Terriglobia bacterium]|nr:hypothetical protein [Terriglobia bacterium]